MAETDEPTRPTLTPIATATGNGGGRFFTIQDPGDPQPYALVCDRGTGIYDWWTGDDTGWVDTPHFAAYFLNGEPTATEIDASTVDDWKSKITVPEPGAVALMRASR